MSSDQKARYAPTPRVLVTGGAGFIGSHLCDRYLKDGWEVVAVDNFFTGSRRNIAHLEDHPRFEWIRHDITDPIAIESDLILNFACPASPIHYQHDPIHTTKTSVLGTMNLLELARRTKARFIQASTSEVYGDPQVHPQKEDYWGNVNPIGIRSCYDEGKRLAETLTFDYRRQHGVDVGVVRIFNTYGPRMDPHDGRVVSNFITQAIQGHKLTVYGDGSQTRSFCYVDDLVDGIVKIAAQRATGPFNLGNDGEFTVRELAETILQKLPASPSTIELKPLPEDDPKVRRPDLSYTSQSIDWRPKVPLDQGLDQTIRYFSDLA